MGMGKVGSFNVIHTSSLFEYQLSEDFDEAMIKLRDCSSDRIRNEKTSLLMTFERSKVEQQL